jgi:hypothetical protein
MINKDNFSRYKIIKRRKKIKKYIERGIFIMQKHLDEFYKYCRLSKRNNLMRELVVFFVQKKSIF